MFWWLKPLNHWNIESESYVEIFLGVNTRVCRESFVLKWWCPQWCMNSVEENYSMLMEMNGFRNICEVARRNRVKNEGVKCRVFVRKLWYGRMEQYITKRFGRLKRMGMDTHFFLQYSLQKTFISYRCPKLIQYVVFFYTKFNNSTLIYIFLSSTE